MFNIIRSDKNYVCFAGDIHGNFTVIPYTIKRVGFKDTLWVFCGDCGFGYESVKHYNNIFNSIKKTLSEYNCECLFLRGNHDDPSFFDGKKIDFEGFKAIPDYSVIITQSHNILCVGGGVSIDRNKSKEDFMINAKVYSLYHGCTLEEAKTRIPKLYWEDEFPTFKPEIIDEISSSDIKIDVVCTHTCPSFVGTLTKDSIRSWLQNDERLEDDLNTERHVMDELYGKLKDSRHPIQNWFYGHFHYHKSEYVDNIHFVMLDKVNNGNMDFFDLRS